MRIIESLARVDASVAWTVMIGSATWIDMAGLPRATFDAVFSTPEVITAGVFNPTGSIAVAPGGYRMNGRWSFASGCEHADWLFGNCIESVVDGVPQMRMALLSPEQVVIEDTWTVSGLCGTGSHHFRADGIIVPAERTWRPLADPPCVDEPIVRIPPLALISLITASVPLGLAQGALDDIHAIAAGKVPLLASAPLGPTHTSSSSSRPRTPSCAPRVRCSTSRPSRRGRRHDRRRAHPGTARPDPGSWRVGHRPLGRRRRGRLPVRRWQLDLR
jgi:indole-3-acetate monooxygenase